MRHAEQLPQPDEQRGRSEPLLAVALERELGLRDRFLVPAESYQLVGQPQPVAYLGDGIPGELAQPAVPFSYLRGAEVGVVGGADPVAVVLELRKGLLAGRVAVERSVVRRSGDREEPQERDAGVRHRDRF